jgi:SagB-type dehydrogenase family enzyme
MSMNTKLDPEAVYRLNPFIRVRLGPPITCDLLLDGESLVLPDCRYLRVLADFDRPRAVAALIGLITCSLDLEWEQAEKVVTQFVESQLLVPEGRHYAELAGVKHWVKRGWLDALILHLRSRNIPYADDKVHNPDNHNARVLSGVIEAEGLPEIWKEFPDRRPTPLCDPGELPRDKTFEKVLLQRRSNQSWHQGYLTGEQLSTITHFANLETRRLRVEAEREWRKDPAVLLNSAFSAIETYFFAFDVRGLAPGLYHYDLREHRAVLLRQGIFRDEVIKMCIGQSRPGGSACVFVLTAIWRRYMYRYRHPRAYRTLLTNVAELAQKYILLATAFDLSTFLTPALQDEYADQLLEVNGYEEAPLYVVAVG